MPADDSSLSSASNISKRAKLISCRRLRLVFPWFFRFFNFIRRIFTPSVTPADDLSLSSDSSIPMSQINLQPNKPPFFKRNRGVLLGVLASVIVIFCEIISNMSQYQPSTLTQSIAFVQSIPLTMEFQIQFSKGKSVAVNQTLCYVLSDLMDFNMIENVNISIQNLSDNEVDIKETQTGS